MHRENLANLFEVRCQTQFNIGSFYADWLKQNCINRFLNTTGQCEKKLMFLDGLNLIQTLAFALKQTVISTFIQYPDFILLSYCTANLIYGSNF